MLTFPLLTYHPAQLFASRVSGTVLVNIFFRIAIPLLEVQAACSNVLGIMVCNACEQEGLAIESQGEYSTG